MPVKYSSKVGIEVVCFSVVSKQREFFNITYIPKQSNQQEHQLHCGGHKHSDGKSRG